MKQSSMLKVGLTGGIGTGKSTVSAIFKAYGIPVIDADLIARKVLLVHPEILEIIKERFGEEYFDDKGTFLRRKMGALIFTNSEKKQEYESIILPYIIEDIFRDIKEYADKERKISIVDAPTLIESNLHVKMDMVVVVRADKEMQIKRVMKRDGYTREEALQRISSQMSTEEKIKYADYVIDNNGDFKDTEEQVRKLIEELLMK